MFSLVRILAATAVFLIIPPTLAQAERLSAKECKSLTTKKNALVKSGAARNMARGVKWAKKNLAKPALNDIKAFIETSEQLLFRCGSKRMKNVDLRNKKVPQKKKKNVKAQGAKKPKPKKAPKVQGPNTDGSAQRSVQKNSRIAKATPQRNEEISDQEVIDHVKKFLDEAEK